MKKKVSYAVSLTAMYEYNNYKVNKNGTSSFFTRGMFSFKTLKEAVLFANKAGDTNRKRNPWQYIHIIQLTESNTKTLLFLRIDNR